MMSFKEQGHYRLIVYPADNIRVQKDKIGK